MSKKTTKSEEEIISEQIRIENERILANAREERTAMLKEAREVKDKIINEAKDQAKFEASKIINEASSSINIQKQNALKEINDFEINSFSKEIEFPPHLVEAGLSLLNHFSSIINFKYKGQQIKVRIEQSNNLVKLAISSPAGEILEMIEQDLATFGKIIKGEKTIDEIISDPIQKLKFEQKIEMISLELSFFRKLALEKDKIILMLENEKFNLYSIIDKSFSHMSKNHDIILELMQTNKGNISLYNYLSEIRLELAKAQINEVSIKEQLLAIRKSSPEKASKVGEYIVNFFSSTISGVFVEWIKQTFMKSM